MKITPNQVITYQNLKIIIQTPLILFISLSQQDGPLSTMIREARKKDDVISGGSGNSSSSRQSIEASFVSSISCKHSSLKTALEHDCHHKGDQEYRSDHQLQRTPSKQPVRSSCGPGLQESINLTTSPISLSSSNQELSESSSSSKKVA